MKLIRENCFEKSERNFNFGRRNKNYFGRGKEIENNFRLNTLILKILKKKKIKVSIKVDSKRV